MRLKKQIAFMLCAGMTFLLAACGSEPQEESGSTVKVIRDTIAHEDMFDYTEIGDIYVTERTPGIIGPLTQDLQFTGAGKFERYLVELGDEVKKGDVLASADDSGLDDQIEALNEQIAKLTENYNNTMTGYDDEVAILDIKDARNATIPWGYIDKTNNKYSRWRIDLNRRQTTEMYEYNLGKLKEQLKELEGKRTGNEIIAPFDGVILARAELYSGDSVTEDGYYMTIADTTKVCAYSEYTAYANSKSTEKTYILYNGKQYDVTYIPIDPKTYSALVAQQATMYMQFTFNEPDDSLRFGDRFTLVAQKSSATDVITLNKCAIRQDTVGKYVYVQENGSRVKKYIVTGLTDGVRVEVKEGLVEGEKVYVDD